jgi:GTP-binding protein
MPKKGGGTRWRVVRAEFEKSATGLADFPAAGLPEFAVAGRSNVGKSSLLNAFAHQRGLARVSKTPGRTRLLNCFRITLTGPRDQGDEGRNEAGPVDLRWVDLPGYGFAAAARSIRDSFGPMIESYLGQRERLVAMILLVDARRGLRDAELELLEFMSARGRPTLVCATKIDKLKASERGLVAGKLARELGVDARDILLTSSSTGMGLGDDPRSGGLARELAELALEAGRGAQPGDEP